MKSSQLDAARQKVAFSCSPKLDLTIGIFADDVVSGVLAFSKGFSKEKEDYNFPIDIVSLAETNPDLLYGDYTSWVYLFRQGELIYSERPCAERK